MRSLAVLFCFPGLIYGMSVGVNPFKEGARDGFLVGEQSIARFVALSASIATAYQGAQSATETKEEKHELSEAEDDETNPISCDLSSCDKNFNNKEEYYDHLKEKSDHWRAASPPSKSLTCLICNTTKKHPGHFWEHLRMHACLYDCEQCGKRTTTQSGFVIHTNRHTGRRTQKCNKCPSKFYTQQELRNHLASHANRQELQCPDCFKRYNTKTALTTHKSRKHR